MQITARTRSLTTSFWNRSLRKFQLTAPALVLVLTLLSHDTVQLPHIEQPAADRPRVIELDSEENSARSPATSARLGHSLEELWPVMWRAEAPRLGSVHNSFVKKEKRPSL